MRWLVLLLLGLALAGPGASAAERRVALVVGVAAYQHVPVLPNTGRDAAAITAALRRLGFDVELAADPDRGALESAVRRFGERARGADAAVFYYAGHALELGGRNWLAPTTANPRNERDMRFEALDLDTVLEQTEGGARVTLIFLDSCRDNPFKLQLATGSRGIARSGLAQASAAVGTLVVFSTAPGSVAADGTGPNSPFTTALLKHIEEPGVEVRQVVAEVRRDVREATGGRQVPWENSALEGQFFFRAPPDAARPGGAGASAGTNASAATAGARDGVDALFWQSIRTSRNPDDLRAYLARFPDGVFAQLARNRLSQLQPGAPAALAMGAAPREAASRDTTPAPGIPSPAESAGAVRSPLADALDAAIAARAPGLATPERRAARVAEYLAMGRHKALMAAANGAGTWMSGGWQIAERVRDEVAERCQVFYGQPCGPIAIDDVVLPLSGVFASASMPHTQYAGQFDAEQIPGLTKAQRETPAIQGYRAATSPKAAAYHPMGRLFTAVDAANARQAQERALAQCNDDPQRGRRDGPCYLYAVGNQVVLAQRRTGPMP